MPTVPLGAIAFARSGDKGDTADLSLFAPDAATFDRIAEQVTAERVAALLGSLVRGPVQRYLLPNLLAVKFVCGGALGGGGPASLRADNLGKSLAGALLRLPVEVPDDQPLLPRPPRDPYAGATWLVEPRQR